MTKQETVDELDQSVKEKLARLHESVCVLNIVLDKLLTDKQKLAFNVIRDEVAKERAQKEPYAQEYFPFPKVSLRKKEPGNKDSNLFYLVGVGEAENGFTQEIATELCEYFNKQPIYQYRLKNESCSG